MIYIAVSVCKILQVNMRAETGIFDRFFMGFLSLSEAESALE